MGKSRSVAAGVAAWTVGAATAVAVGVGALTLIGGGLTEGPLPAAALSQPTDVPADRPGVSPSGTPSSSPRPTVAPSSTTQPARTQADRTITTNAGTVVARCTPAGAYLVGWSPLPGYRTDDAFRGPAAIAHVTFESVDRETRVTVRCVGGVVQPLVTDESTHDH